MKFVLVIPNVLAGPPQGPLSWLMTLESSTPARPYCLQYRVFYYNGTTGSRSILIPHRPIEWRVNYTAYTQNNTILHTHKTNFTIKLWKFFYCTASMQAQSSYEHLSVHLSACPSVKRVNCDTTKQTSANIPIPYERSIHLVFWHEEWLVGDVSFYLKFWTKLPPPASKTAISNLYSLVVPQHLHLAKKSSVITNRMTTTRFPMRMWWHIYHHSFRCQRKCKWYTSSSCKVLDHESY